MANCYIHENKTAKARCTRCKKVMCEDCMPAYDDEERICPVCKKAELEKDVNNYFWILLFIGIAFVGAGFFVFWFITNTLHGFQGMDTVGIAVISTIILIGVFFFIYLFIVDFKIYKNCLSRLDIANKYLNKQSEQDLDKMIEDLQNTEKDVCVPHNDFVVQEKQNVEAMQEVVKNAEEQKNAAKKTTAKKSTTKKSTTTSKKAEPKKAKLDK